MPAFLLDSGKQQTTAGISLDDVTEEVLNGMFCHYEPPTSESAQNFAAKESKEKPENFKMPNRNKSILRNSPRTPKILQKPKVVEKKTPKEVETPKNVTWGDEEKAGFEENIASCTTSCDVLAKSTIASAIDVIEALTPKESKAETEEKEVTETAPLNDDDAPAKKVLYDDEGNSINEDGNEILDENTPPTPTYAKGCDALSNFKVNVPDCVTVSKTVTTLLRNLGGEESKAEDKQPTPRYGGYDEDLDETESEFLARMRRRRRKSRSRSRSRSRSASRSRKSLSKSPRMGLRKLFGRPQTPHSGKRSKNDLALVETDYAEHDRALYRELHPDGATREAPNKEVANTQAATPAQIDEIKEPTQEATPKEIEIEEPRVIPDPSPRMSMEPSEEPVDLLPPTPRSKMQSPVSSVGMESNTVRPLEYTNPFLEEDTVEKESKTKTKRKGWGLKKAFGFGKVKSMAKAIDQKPTSNE